MIVETAYATLVITREPAHPNAPNQRWAKIHSSGHEPLLVVDEWTLFAVVIQYLKQRVGVGDALLVVQAHSMVRRESFVALGYLLSSEEEGKPRWMRF